MPDQISVTRQRELALREACHDLSNDLRKIEPASYFLFFELGELPAVYEQVNLYLDQHFPKGKLAFACTGQTSIGWTESPQVAVDLEFSGEDILAFFRLVIGSKEHDVELHHISFQQSVGDPHHNTIALSKALERARS